MFKSIKAKVATLVATLLVLLGVAPAKAAVDAAAITTSITTAWGSVETAGLVILLALLVVWIVKKIKRFG